jgi:hypothetical protein
LKKNGAPLIREINVGEKGLSTPKFQMFYHFWNIINLHKILRIETLQVVEPFKKKLTIEITMFPLWFFKDLKLQF